MKVNEFGNYKTRKYLEQRYHDNRKMVVIGGLALTIILVVINIWFVIFFMIPLIRATEHDFTAIVVVINAILALLGVTGSLTVMQFYKDNSPDLLLSKMGLYAKKIFLEEMRKDIELHEEVERCV